MYTNKFKNNFKKLLEIFSEDDVYKFLMDKGAFSEDFVKMLQESKALNKYKKGDSLKFDLNDLKKTLNYDVGYENNKVVVKVLKNEIFSYTDDDNTLYDKLKNYIQDQEFEKAVVLRNYMNMIELNITLKNN